MLFEHKKQSLLDHSISNLDLPNGHNALKSSLKRDLRGLCHYAAFLLTRS
uniref:Uncharacterized protein n=1 Tax=Anguilla anguilla TaxID=7936 RepID=A0A0E9TRL9_ANGAN